MQRASSFVDEIRSSLEFYTAQSQGARIARVLITGGGSKLDGFLDLLRQRIPVQVDPGQVFQRARSQLSLSPEALTEAEPLLAVAIGLADPREGFVSQVNLLPPDILEAQKWRRLTLLVAAIGAVIVVLVIGFYLLQVNTLSSVNADIEDRNQTNESINAQIASKQKYATLQAEAAAQEQKLSLAYAGEVSFSALLMDTSRVIPSDAYLEHPVAPDHRPRGDRRRCHHDRSGREHHGRREGREHRHPGHVPDAPGVREGLGEPVHQHDRRRHRDRWLQSRLVRRRPHRRGRHPPWEGCRCSRVGADRWSPERSSPPS